MPSVRGSLVSQVEPEEGLDRDRHMRPAPQISLICLGNFRTDNLSSYSVLFVINKNILHFKTIHSNSIQR